MELILVDLSPVYQRLFHYIFDIKFCNEIYFCNGNTKRSDCQFLHYIS